MVGSVLPIAPNRLPISDDQRGIKRDKTGKATPRTAKVRKCAAPLILLVEIDIGPLAASGFYICGYTTSQMANTSFVGMTLPKVGGGEEFFFKDLKTNCDETGDEELSAIGWQAESDSINMLSDSGTFLKTIIYLPEWLAGEGYGVSKGWYERDNYGEGLDFNDEPIDFGYSIQVSIFDASLGPKITFAGEVKQGPTVTDCANTMSLANCAPKKIYAENLIINCDETGDEELSAIGWQAESDSINMLSESGTFLKTIIYLPEWLAGEGYGVPKGWYERDNYGEGLDYNHSEDLCWEPGEGFQVSIFDATLGPTISIKSALAKEDEE